MSGYQQSRGLSRRVVLAGLGAGGGLSMVAGFPAGIAGASQVERRAPGAVPATLQADATSLNPALRYVLLCGHEFSPLESPASYNTLDGQFRFLGTSSG